MRWDGVDQDARLRISLAPEVFSGTSDVAEQYLPWRSARQVPFNEQQGSRYPLPPW